MPEALQADIHLTRPARGLIDTRFTSIPASEPAHNLTELIEGPDQAMWFFAVEGSRVVGVLGADCLLPDGEAQETTVGDKAKRDFCPVWEDSQLAEVARTMMRRKCSLALVVRKGRPLVVTDILGVITKSRIADALAESIDAFET